MDKTEFPRLKQEAEAKAKEEKEKAEGKKTQEYSKRIIVPKGSARVTKGAPSSAGVTAPKATPNGATARPMEIACIRIFRRRVPSSAIGQRIGG